jgi:[histone H3]-lysine4 N-trimethyltransferase MLL3
LGCFQEEGVGSLLELGDDDDELLGLGADFNILLYADPDLDTAPGGAKTNILDFVHEEPSDDKKDAAPPRYANVNKCFRRTSF